MPYRTLFRLLAAALALIAAPTLASADDAAGLRNWNATITVTPDGWHVLGNPAAPVKVVEYLSYSCPHCAAFEKEGVSALRMDYVSTGKVSLEIHPLLMFVTDPAVTIIAQCATPLRFLGLHDALLARQEEWFGRAEHLTRGQKARWTHGDTGARLRAMADDMGLYAIAAGHGIDRVAADRCLSDRPAGQKLAQDSMSVMGPEFEGTPSFAINGVMLRGTHDWKGLEALLKARM